MAQQTIYNTKEARRQSVETGERWHQCESPTGRKGFYLRVSPQGGHFYYRFVNALGKQRKLRLGDCKAMTFAQAAEAHMVASRSVDEGGDPVQEVRDSRAASRQVGAVPDSMEALITLWVDHISTKVSTNTWRGYESWCRNWITPVIGRLHPHSLTSLDVRTVRDKAHAYSGPTGVKALRITKQLVKWGVGELLMPVDVAAPIQPLEKNKPRTAYLSAEQYRELWQVLDGDTVWPMVARIIKLLAYTGARRNEIVLLEHGEVQWGKDRLDAVLVIPALRTKMKKREHSIYLPPSAASLLRAAVDNSESDRWVFSGKIRGRSINPNTVTQTFSGIASDPAWSGLVLHSLRHSFLTHCHGENLADYLDIEAAVGHQLPGMGALYTHSENMAGMRKVWLAWESWLDNVLAGKSGKEGGTVHKLFG